MMLHCQFDLIKVSFAFSDQLNWICKFWKKAIYLLIKLLCFQESCSSYHFWVISHYFLDEIFNNHFFMLPAVSPIYILRTLQNHFEKWDTLEDLRGVLITHFLFWISSFVFPFNRLSFSFESSNGWWSPSLYQSDFEENFLLNLC